MDQSFLSQLEQKDKKFGNTGWDQREINNDISPKEDSWLQTAYITCKFGCKGGDDCNCK